MAALIPKNTFAVAKRQSICATGVAVQVCYYSDTPRIIKNPTTASLKRGTGGRSSYNGITCTIFGNTGFLGRYVINRLGKIGTQLILPTRGDMYDSMPYKVAGDLGQILFHPFDLRDEESIRRCVKYSNVVINLIGRDWETKNFTFNDVHIEGARTLARIAKESGVERFIHVSSAGANPNPTPMLLKNGSQFMKTKWYGEQAVKEEFPEATIVRPGTIFGQEDRFFKCFGHSWRTLFQSIPIWKKGEATEKQPLWAGDVAAGITALVNDPNTIGKTYQFLGPKRYKLSEIVDYLFRIMRKTPDLGFARTDVETSYFFQLKVTINEKISPAWPMAYLHWEGLEKEATSDKYVKGMPGLEDLGVNPIEMETQADWEMFLHKSNRHYKESLGEFDKPALPKTIPIF
ncbi:NADH dehydrogenase [ubiquinone] 1 alpha subcomplex subunit 9, mitochondrial [Cephus cinctus]|uniref:NADH dehydrogenase [ubiquinone] 1 alpha subcomplex subunit 9, mitochondrial n=1 Tax=Cephus cinctus TaxID=211228 RepID=A0AAJ7BXP5_CEPCN|nr:NADH dehydrogenase [ubiquinone] 1 alpha subcomplex subunit 9, mitochondrial [Cephus cinctus]